MSAAGGSTPGGTPTRPLRPRRASSEPPAAGTAAPARGESLASLGALAGDLAHEIRNPLVALKSFLELLPERRGDPEVEIRFLEVAREELRRAERLLDAMIDARRSPGRSDPPGDVAAAVGAVATLLGPRAHGRGVRIEIRVAPGLPAVALGADALRQVLLNLALNAVDASPRGARIGIDAGPDADAVAIEVADEGPGLRAPGRARERSAPRPGGLGLAITRRLLAAAGGTLTTRPAPGGGTRARVRLPATPRSR